MLIWAMLAAALLAATSSVLAQRWAQELRREREDHLLLVGDEIAGALQSYALASTPGERRHPLELNELLNDRRAFGLSRHLRRIPQDPITNAATWGLVRGSDGGIIAVHSLSVDAPMRVVALSLVHADLAAALRYADWKFKPRAP